MIADYLQRGRNNAIPLHWLEKQTGTPSRTIRRMIAKERLAGVPILSDANCRGYWLADSESEKVQFVRQMRSRAKEINRAADAVEGGKDYDEIR